MCLSSGEEACEKRTLEICLEKEILIHGINIFISYNTVVSDSLRSPSSILVSLDLSRVSSLNVCYAMPVSTRAMCSMKAVC